MAVMIKEAILKKAHGLFGVRPVDIVGPSKYGMYIPARFAICLALRRRGWSFHKIGRMLGNRDHTTIIHACERAEYTEERDPEYAAKIKALVELQVHVTEGVK